MKIGNITFDGANGTIQLPKPMIEHYTILGDNRVFTQKVNVSSNESSITAFKSYPNVAAIGTECDNLNKIVGKRMTVIYNGVTYLSCYVIDYTRTYRMVAGCMPYLATYELKIILDQRTSDGSN